jgi:hypothetical protein
VGKDRHVGKDRQVIKDRHGVSGNIEGNTVRASNHIKIKKQATLSNRVNGSTKNNGNNVVSDSTEGKSSNRISGSSKTKSRFVTNDDKTVVDSNVVVDNCNLRLEKVHITIFNHENCSRYKNLR